MFLRGRTMFAPTMTPSAVNSQRKNQIFIRFFFCKIRCKRKSYQKENAEISFRALRSATDAAVGSCRLPKNAGENFNGLAKTLLQQKNY